MAEKKIIHELITKLTADGAQHAKALKDNVKETKTWGDRVTSIAKTASVAMAASGVAIAGSLAVLTRVAINNADAMGEQAEMLGTTSERLSAMTYAAHMSAVSQEELSGALTKLNKVSADAFKGVGKGVEAFDILGVSVTDTDGKLKDSTVLVTELSEKFSKLPDGPAKSALAMDLFGKSGSKLIPLLNQGREGIAELTTEAERLGLVISTDTAQQAGQFNDQMDKLGFAVDGLGLRIATRALPQLNELLQIISDPKVQNGTEVIASGLLKVAEYAVKAGAETVKFYSSISTGLRQLVSEVDLNNLEEVKEKLQEIAVFRQNKALSAAFDPLAFMEFSKMPVGELARYEASLRKIKQAQEELQAPGAAGAKLAMAPKLIGNDDSAIEERWKKYQLEEEAKKKSKKATEDLLAQEKQLNSEIVSQGDSYRRTLTLTAESTELQKLHYEIAFGGLKGINAERKKELELMAEVIDAQTAANLKAKERKEIEDLLMTDAERINKLWDERIKKIKELGLSEAEATALIKKAQDQRADDLKNAAKKSEDDMSEFSKQAARNMQSAFADFLFDPFEDGLDGMFKSFGNTLRRMAAEAAAAAIFESVGNWGKSNSSSPGWVGAVGTIASFFGGAYAEGGRPPMGKISIVGDGGEPELFVPDTAGTIVPFSHLGGGNSVSIGQMVFPGITNANEAKRAAGAAGRELLGVMNAAQRYA